MSDDKTRDTAVEPADDNAPEEELTSEELENISGGSGAMGSSGSQYDDGPGYADAGPPDD